MVSFPENGNHCRQRQRAAPAPLRKASLSGKNKRRKPIVIGTCFVLFFGALLIVTYLCLILRVTSKNSTSDSSSETTIIKRDSHAEVKKIFAVQELPYDINKALEAKDGAVQPNRRKSLVVPLKKTERKKKPGNRLSDSPLYSHFSTLDDAVAATNNTPPERSVIRKHFQDKPYGKGVDPEQLYWSGNASNRDPLASEYDTDMKSHPDPDHVLKAFLEPIDWKNWWQAKPLPVRNYTADDLVQLSYPELRSCTRLPEQWPVDDYPEMDPFLPWIHDVFPTHDGQFIQFVAQNRRKCRSGFKNPDESKIVAWTQPQAALFQHVPVQRLTTTTSEHSTRYRLSSHQDADGDGEATRFICRFKQPAQGKTYETLSVFNFDYDWTIYLRRHKFTFDEFDAGIKSNPTSQLLFKCPVPTELIDTIERGTSVQNDWATIFVDLIPIRTPPRYGIPSQFFQNYYKDDQAQDPNELFDPDVEWGNHHILPRIEQSGRWENIPICKTSLDTYYNNNNNNNQEKQQDDELNHNDDGGSSSKPVQKHRLVACLWASSGYTTRGNRFAINDGQRRLLEWMHYNKLIGFDHFYIYDNSHAHYDGTSDAPTTLKPILDLEPFSNISTYIPWPSKVCNNRPNNVDSPGHRSSQYAAESSCRLRFGPHVEWIGQFDIDEYVVPMGDYTSVLPLLDKLDEEGMRILSFGSWRAWPRKSLIEEPILITDDSICESRGRPCFDLRIPKNRTVLQTYNCDRGPEKKVMPAEKQIYKANYVLQHFIHYSTVTALSVLNKNDWNHNAQVTERDFFTDNTRNRIKYGFRRGVFPDPRSRFVDEEKEGTMLHTKALAVQDTADWPAACMGISGYTCRIGIAHDADSIGSNTTRNKDGFKYNCYVNTKLENYFVPRLEQILKEKHGNAIFGNNQN